MTSIDDLKSRAGQLLYRELPEEYRYQDPAPEGELGDLEAYLHGFGHLLDLVRGTTEQAYADAFAEPADNGREIQTWLIPYLAELVGAELRAPMAVTVIAGLVSSTLLTLVVIPAVYVAVARIEGWFRRTPAAQATPEAA